MDVEDVDYWAVPEALDLEHESKDGAIKAFLDECEVTPEKMNICAYRLLKIKYSPESIAKDVIEGLLERFDEDCEVEDETEITDEMKKCAKEFVEKFIPLYPIHRCGLVYQEEVNVKKWMLDNKYRKVVCRL